MMKKILALLLTFCLYLPCTLAEGLTLPDPAQFSAGALTFSENRDNTAALQRWYTVQGNTAAQYVAAYQTMLEKEPTLKYVGSKTEDYGTYKGIHHYYAPSNASYACFSLPNIADNICFDIYYSYGGNYAAYNVVLFCSTDITLSTAEAAPAASIQSTLPRIQDPLSFFGEELTHWSKAEKTSKGFWISFTAKSYSVGDALFSVYSEYLLQLGFTQTDAIERKWGDIYYCFDAPSGSAFGTYPYSFTDVKGKSRSISPALFICHKPGAMYMEFAFAPGLEVTDLGLRLDASLQQNLGEIGYKERQEYIRNIMAEAAEARGESPASSGSSSSSSTSYSNSQKRYKNCPAVRCNNGKVPCSRCDGEGGKWVTKSTPNYSGSTSGSKSSRTWESCSKCYGGKTQDCSTCNGRGKVEY